MSRHPIQGVAGAKPKLPKAGQNGETSKEEVAKLGREYLSSRNRTQSAKAELAEMELARRKGLLIDKKRAFDSLSYISVCWRQRCLLSPRITARRLVVKGLVDQANEHNVSMALDADMRELLDEIARLPEKVVDPNWIDELARKEVGLTEVEHQPTPAEHKVQQSRAARRAEKKIAAQQVRREHG